MLSPVAVLVAPVRRLLDRGLRWRGVPCAQLKRLLYSGIEFPLPPNYTKSNLVSDVKYVSKNMSEMQSEEYWESLVKRSLCRFLLLSQLAKGPLHGYGVNRAIKEACQGCCEPTEAMVYSTMKELQDRGYVESRMEEHLGRKRRVCWLSSSGEQAFQSAARVWERMLPAVQECIEQARDISGTAART